MILTLRTRSNELQAKDILDLDFDVFIEETKDPENSYIVWLNKDYRLNESFDTLESAEMKVIKLVDSRNDIEDSINGW